jgi:ribosomal protein S18 acetylase RimI-like enzyme
MTTSPGSTEIRELDIADTNAIVDTLVSIWSQENPDLSRVPRKQLYQYLTRCPGFRCRVAAAGDGTIAGFAIGTYRDASTESSVDATGTYELIEGQMEYAPVAPRWLSAFDLAELQVLESYRDQRTGRRLVHALLDDLPKGERVVLTVNESAGAARHLYDDLGFKELFSVQIKSKERPLTEHSVMGRTMPLST